MKKAMAIVFMAILLVSFLMATAQKAKEFWRPIFEDNIDEVKRLIKDGVDVNEKYDWAVWRDITALYSAVMWGRAEICNILIDAGADVNVIYTGGYTILHVAARYGGDKAITELLIANGADVNAKCTALGADKDVTPLHAAAAKGTVAVAEVLIKNGAEVNAKATHVGYAPLHLAVGSGHKAVAELLIANRAEVNTKTKHEETPLDLAISNRHEELADLLRKHGGKSGRK
jgi:ankyrin repeat protein